jgi:hypothetical protein
LSAVADVVVVDTSGQPVAGAVATGTWSGQAKGTASAVTGSDGKGSTPENKLRRSGKVSFGVSSVQLPAGYAWDGVLKTGSAKI